MPPARPDASSEAARELVGALALAAAGVGLRFAFVHAFPTIPVSDFRALVAFGLLFRDGGWLVPGWEWFQFNPGLPMVLSLLFRLFPHHALEAARDATALVTGLVPLLPYFIWRGALSFRLRLLAGALLALWPGQVVFSGVVAQDNWVLVPTIALASLAVRRLLSRPHGIGRPVAAGLLYAAAVAIRQEMLVALLPLLAATAFSWRRGGVARREAGRLILAAGIPLLLLAGQRAAATGRFALTTEHGGLGFLGSFVPGASAAGWVNPRPYLASVDPSLLTDSHRLFREAGRLARSEAGRRPAFHAFRIGVAALRMSVESDASNLFASVVEPGSLPGDRAAAGERFSRRWLSALRVELALVQGLFAAALVIGFRRRDPAILVLCAAVFLKVLVHVVVGAIGRLFLPATALELLTLPLAAVLLPAGSRREKGLAGALAILVPVTLLGFVPPLKAAVSRRDQDVPRRYRFPLFLIGGGGRLRCEMDSGQLTLLENARVTMQTFQRNPAPGDRARADCVLTSFGSPDRLVARILDSYVPGGLPDRMIARVELDGREIYRRDLAGPPGAGWFEVPIGRAAGEPMRLAVELRAVRPEPTWGWGQAAPLTFEVARVPSPR